MTQLLLVAMGGAAGAAARYGVGVLTGRWLGHGRPWTSLGVDLLGGLIPARRAFG